MIKSGLAEKLTTWFDVMKTYDTFKFDRESLEVFYLRYFSTSDIDIYIYGLSSEDAKAKVKIIIIISCELSFICFFIIYF